MTENDRIVGHRLLETGVVVPFRLLEHEILPAPDPAEFGARLKLKFEPDDEHEGPEDIVEWGAFGFMFVLAMLSFADARPRESSVLEYREADELTVADFLACLSFRRGVLEFQADYIRGRRVKTDIAVCSDGSVTLTTNGRGKAPFHWLDRIQGKKAMRVIDRE
jgi:hypothetical protein